MITPERPIASRSRVPRNGLHYDVIRARDGLGDIRTIQCQYCAFSVRVLDYRRGGDRSGLPRFNRSRAVMVKHLYAEHRALIVSAASLPSENPTPQKGGIS